MKTVLSVLFSMSALSLVAGPAMAQKKPACHQMCTAYCNKRVAAGTSVGFNACYKECRRISSDPTYNRCTN